MLDNLTHYDIVLASASPRRHELLKGLGIDFRVEVLKGIDERYPADLEPRKIPEFLSQLKANAYALKPDELLITADTVVISGGKVLGKPADRAQAIAMLQSLSGHDHEVTTGVTILTSEKQVTFGCTSMVTFAQLTQAEIEHYVDTCHPMDKAGAYGIQEWIGYIGISGIRGSFYNVMGLPVQRLYEALKQF